MTLTQGDATNSSVTFILDPVNDTAVVEYSIYCFGLDGDNDIVDDPAPGNCSDM